MENKPVKNKSALQKLASENSIDLKGLSEQDKLNKVLNSPPPAQWITKHPFAKNVDYLPIDKVESLLTQIFQFWKVEVISYSQIFNSVSCHIRLHYKNPITGEWSYHDGLGAVGIQVNKGADASDLSSIKTDSVMKALPASKSYALKDAADHLGALFGRDLNRNNPTPYKETYSNYWEEKIMEEKSND